jgi:hypothetical protein
MKAPLVLSTKILFIIAAWSVIILPVQADVSIAYRTDSAQLNFAVSRLAKALRKANETAVVYDLADLRDKDIIIVADETEVIFLPGTPMRQSINPLIRQEGFQIRKFRSGNKLIICVIARDETGAMYGTLDIAEQIQMKSGLRKVKEKVTNPHFVFRAIKFNLPWSSYRPNENPAMSLHTQTCRDLIFWQRFLDMMAENRFNVLSLWNLHPFTYMIRPKNFPEACPFSDRELAQWQLFWRRLFSMAKARGIETYIVNWNIVVSPEFANKEREDWIQNTFIKGMKQAKRPAKFIHRSVLAGSPLEMRRVIEEANFPDPVWVEVKFNWSHGHSTPRLAITHDYSSGQIDERFWNPKPTNYQIAWMIRNEDFFILRWGQPDFIREHIALNGRDYVGGYFIGSKNNGCFTSYGEDYCSIRIPLTLSSLLISIVVTATILATNY